MALKEYYNISHETHLFKKQRHTKKGFRWNDASSFCYGNSDSCFQKWNCKVNVLLPVRVDLNGRHHNVCFVVQQLSYEAVPSVVLQQKWAKFWYHKSWSKTYVENSPSTVLHPTQFVGKLEVTGKLLKKVNAKTSTAASRGGIVSLVATWHWSTHLALASFIVRRYVVDKGSLLQKYSSKVKLKTKKTFQ